MADAREIGECFIEAFNAHDEEGSVGYTRRTPSSKRRGVALRPLGRPRRHFGDLDRQAPSRHAFLPGESGPPTTGRTVFRALLVVNRDLVAGYVVLRNRLGVVRVLRCATRIHVHRARSEPVRRAGDAGRSCRLSLA